MYNHYLIIFNNYYLFYSLLIIFIFIHLINGLLLKTYIIKNNIYRDINVPNGWEFRKDNEKYQLNFTAPEVEVHCLYGSGIDTVQRYLIIF